MMTASDQLVAAEVSGLRAMAQPPTAPKAARATGSLDGARQDNNAPSSSDTTTIPASNRGFCIVPNVSIVVRTTDPGVRSTTSSPTATTGERRRLDRLEPNWPTERAMAAARNPSASARNRSSALMTRA